MSDVKKPFPKPPSAVKWEKPELKQGDIFNVIRLISFQWVTGQHPVAQQSQTRVYFKGKI